jgi:hypothetical protein
MGSVDFGPNVHVFDKSMSDAAINSQLQTIYNAQNTATSEFGTGRAAIFFKPGDYNINVDVGYYMTVHGLPGPTGWAVSQATYLRSVHVQGRLFLWDYRYDYKGGNFSSGGFMADCTVDGITISGTQQQFCLRNCALNR